MELYIIKFQHSLYTIDKEEEIHKCIEEELERRFAFVTAEYNDQITDVSREWLVKPTPKDTVIIYRINYTNNTWRHPNHSVQMQYRKKKLVE